MKWILKLFWREADFAIGGKENPYLLRWYVLPRNRWLNLYLHKFMRDDDDRAFHDHPWWFVSLLLSGTYFEHRPIGTQKRRWLSLAFRRADALHRVTLDDGKPAWTLVVTGPRVREWGFQCPQGWVHWKDFTTGEYGEHVGKGCGETDTAANSAAEGT